MRSGRSPRGCSCLLVMLAFLGVVTASVLIRLGSRWLVHKVGVLGWLGVLVGGALVIFLACYLYGLWARRRLSRWAQRDGWTTVTGRRDWPWTATEPGVTEPVVPHAYSKTIDGSLVTVGDVNWGPGGMADVAGAAKGDGFFAVLRLPQRYPRLGVHHEYDLYRSTEAGDAFGRFYRIVCADAETAAEYVGREIKDAHLAAELPDWMLIEDELYVVHRSSGMLTPSAAAKIARQVLRVADLLGLTRD